METRKKLMLTLLGAGLALPALALAGNEATKAQSFVAKPKPTIAAPADCKLKAKVRASDAHEKRKASVAKREAAGLVGEKVEFNPDALKNLDKRRKQDKK